MQIFFIVLLCYVLYRFIVGFVLPIASTASRMKKQFQEMQNQQSHFNGSASGSPEQNASFSGASPDKQRTTSGKKGSKDDYIDYEEVPASRS